MDNVYTQLLRENLNYFDTFDYPSNNIHNIPLVNKKVVGLIKDELNGAIMTNFICLRSKMYSFMVDGKKCTKKSKGVKTNVVKNLISFDDYKHCLENKDQIYRTQRTIQSSLHNLYSVEQTKIALSPFDDKRSLLPNSNDTLPWGHYLVENRKMQFFLNIYV